MLDKSLKLFSTCWAANEPFNALRGVVKGLTCLFETR